MFQCIIFITSELEDTIPELNYCLQVKKLPKPHLQICITNVSYDYTSRNWVMSPIGGPTPWLADWPTVSSRQTWTGLYWTVSMNVTFCCWLATLVPYSWTRQLILCAWFSQAVPASVHCVRRLQRPRGSPCTARGAAQDGARGLPHEWGGCTG
jgi:hypothetical protein